MPAITDKDWLDLQFGIDVGVDYYALSFVRSADVIYELNCIQAQLSSIICPEAHLSSFGTSQSQAACVFKSQQVPQTVSLSLRMPAHSNTLLA